MAHEHTVTHGGDTLCQLAVSSATIAEAVYPPRLRVPVHTHAHAHIGFLIAGACRETVGRRPYDYETSSLVIKRAGESHSNQAGVDGTRFLIIDFDETSDHAEILGDRAFFRRSDLAPILFRLLSELRAPDEVSMLACDGLILELLAGIVRNKARRARGAPEWVARAGEMLHDRALEPLVLAELATDLGVHPAHFSRAFRREFGTTPGAFVRSIRLARAMALIVDTNRPFLEVAHETGFSDQSHLTRAVRRETGLPPGEIRRRAQR